MVWMFFARAALPDARVWPGRRALALVDAVAWPAAWVMVVMGLPAANGLTGPFVIAVCAVSALSRVHRAVAHNHRYHFTTRRWGRRVALVLVFGSALKLALSLSV